MAFTMVPVPEEIVDEVLELMFSIMMRSFLGTWDAEALDAFVQDLPEPAVAMLQHLTTALDEGKQLSRLQVSQLMACPMAQVNELVDLVTERLRAEGHPTLLIADDVETGDGEVVVDTLRITRATADVLRPILAGMTA